MLSFSSNQKIKARVNSTISEQKDAYDKILSGKPQEAEEDIPRRIAFQNRRGQEIQEFLTKVDSSSQTSKRILGKEKIQGLSIDFIGVHYLDLAKASAAAVARVIFRDERPNGSGFLISPNLFLTNNHVLPNPEECKKQVLQFNYQQDYRKKSLETSIFELDPDTCFFTNKEDDLDFTVVAVGKKLSGNQLISEYGFIPVFEAPDKHAKGMF